MDGRKQTAVLVKIFAASALCAAPAGDLAAPVCDGVWLRPAAARHAAPIWGSAEGLSIGLWPADGPRGLIRVYAPYLGQPYPRMVNYIAIEPIVSGTRGFSELERGRAGTVQGLSMWTADTKAKAAEAATKGEPGTPARGTIGSTDGVKSLSVFLATGPFHNGAHPIVQVLFHADRPREVGFKTFAAPGSAPIDACVLTATMGNYGRLRRLRLADEVVSAPKLWPRATPTTPGFLPDRTWGSRRLLRVGDDVVVAATSDEPDPASASYDEDVPPWWRYRGRPALQYWRAPHRPDIRVCVNGRATFWGTMAPIPGGAAFENFELVAPFSEGGESWFGVTETPPSPLGFGAASPERGHDRAR